MSTAEEQVRRAAERMNRRWTFTSMVKAIATDRDDVATMRKAAVGAGTSSDETWAAPLATLPGAGTFLELLARRSVLSRVPFLRAPFGVPTPVQTARPTGYRVSAAAAGKPITTLPTTTVTHRADVVGVIVVLSLELVRSTAPGTDEVLNRQLASALGSAINSHFLDPSLTGSITNGLAALPSSGSTEAQLLEDLYLLLGTGDEPVILASLPWAARLVAALGAAAPLVPVVVVPELGDYVVAVDPTGIVVAEGEVDVLPGPSATLMMSDDASGEAGELTSMFQTDSTALRAEIPAAWERVRDGAVVVLDMAGS
jgi:hypothetical protein